MSDITTITIPTPKSALPQWKGRPVPWIARWSGEVSTEKLTYGVNRETGAIEVWYESGNENRDENGILWKKEGLARVGEPQWAEVNTYRQRASMLRRKCQVCGSKITDRAIRWLVPTMEAHASPNGIVTRSGPTCASCIPLALELCPHLKKEGAAQIFKVLEYEPWGIYGEAIWRDPETGGVKDLRGVHVPFDGSSGLAYNQVIAFQMAVEFTKFVRVEAP